MSSANGIGYLISLLSQPACADVPHPWQIGFQTAASPIMEGIAEMHHMLLIIITCIAVLVTGLLAFVLWRFRASRNPIPSNTSHHTLLEVAWTLLPVLILVVIGIPSLKLMFFASKIEHADLTVKAIGHQWYWTYDYPEEKIHFDSLMIEDKDLKPGQLRLLEVDNAIMVPAGKTVRMIVTSEDVLHSFAVPSLGIKKDAVPGRLNETWFRIEKEGTYYGQCSELCGVKHGFMPIAVKVVSQQHYDEWLKSKKSN
jgi:cytochrome c oxidase subunit 2